MTASHVKIGLLSLGLAAVVGLPAAWLSHEREAPGPRTDIAVEHVVPATLHVTRLASSGANVFDIAHTASGAVALHLPSTWKRQEVRGAPIASVTFEETQMGYVRWMLPKGASVRFETPNPGRVTLHNPSGIPITVRTTTVRYPSGLREDDAVIVTDGPYSLP